MFQLNYSFSSSFYKDNDEMIDFLVKDQYIKSSHLENIFRAVDIKDFKTQFHTWDFEHLLTFPATTYAIVLENLKLKPGMSFLVFGSGIGYLNILAGLILGPLGINHGIEINKNIIHYAKNQTEYFYRNSSAVDKFEFCIPEFVFGNCAPDCSSSSSSSSITYDRIYISINALVHIKDILKYIESKLIVKNGSIIIINQFSTLKKFIVKANFTFENPNTFEFENLGFLPFDHDFVFCNNGIYDTPIKLPKMNNNFPKLKDLCRLTIRVLLKAEMKDEDTTFFHINTCMKNKIRKLFIPKSLKIFLNLDRSF